MSEAIVCDVRYNGDARRLYVHADRIGWMLVPTSAKDGALCVDGVVYDFQSPAAFAQARGQWALILEYTR